MMPKKNSAKYWEKRLDEIAQKALDDSSEETLRRMKRLYQDALKVIRKKISSLYDELLVDGELSTTALYQYDRWQSLQQVLVNTLQELGEKEISLLTEALEAAYIGTIGRTAEELAAPVAFTVVNKKAVAEAVKRQAIGGQHFSDRIWKNKDRLLQLLNKKITDVIMLGESKDKAVKAVMERFNVAFSDADRLVRTETMHTINSAQKAAYTSAGYTRYKFLAHIDKRTSDICRELNGQYFNFDDAQVGVNYPPMHPRCRSTVIPDLKSRKRQVDKSQDFSAIEHGDIVPMGKIDLSKLRGIFKNLKTDKVVLTSERLEHIKERHPEAVEYIQKYAKKAIQEPDMILQDSKNADTVMMIKTAEKARVNIIVKLAVTIDSEYSSNSIITAFKMSDKRLQNLAKKHKTIYKKD